MFIMLLPMTLPMEIPALLLAAAAIDTAASGALVPMATMVSPMISSEMPNFLAMPEAPSTNRSAPFTNRAKPTIKIASCLIISMFIN